ncbi:hypothetical protein ACET3Z_027771 [Daucus carota]
MAMRNAMHVWFLVFGMLCMGTILASSELESNKTTLNNNIKCIETERLALLDIKRGLVDTFGSLSSWGSSKHEKDCCQWSFVGCNHHNGHVTHLHLSYLSYRYVYGEPVASNISASLLLLRNLKYLDLSLNMFRVPIPSFIGSLTNLVHLDLSSSGFQGAIPDELGNLSQLSFLDLSHNQLEGKIPNSFHNLSSLQTVNFTDNNFTGNLQDLLYLLPEATLQTLLISENKLTGSLPDITTFSFLTELNVQSNQLNGYLPKQFKHISVLRTLSLSNNQLEGSLPNFSGFSFLKDLYLNDNKFSGSLPDFNGCLALEYLDLSGNQLTGWETQSIGQLTNLVELDLSRNSINRKLVLSMSEIMGLRFLDLSHNLLFGELPDSWKYFENLVFLNLGSNNFCGRIPMSIGYLHSLNKLILRNNRLDGELPESLRKCTNLGFVDFGLNGLSGTVPAWIGQDLPQLYALVLKSNKFYGSLPDDLCHLSHLHFLDLSMNELSGNVPQCFSSLIAMINGTKTTDHHNNSAYPYQRGCSAISRCRTNESIVIYGYLDDALAGWKGKEREYRGNFAYLNMIDLSSNKFTGEFPAGITRLLDMKGLNLSRNQFDGKVPEQIGRLVQLEVLDLSSAGDVHISCS